MKAASHDMGFVKLESGVRVYPGEYLQVHLRNTGSPITETVELRVECDGTFTIYTDLPVKPWVKPWSEQEAQESDEELPRCPKCGYNKVDAMIHGDHRLCDGEIPR